MAGGIFIVPYGVFLVVICGIFVVVCGIFAAACWIFFFFFFGSMTDLFNCDMWDSSVGTCKVFLVAECEIFIVVVCGTFEL